MIATLKRVDGMIDGWGKHYWFCNDGQTFANLDQQIGDHIGAFLGAYRSVKEVIPAGNRMALLGLSELAKIGREPFAYPKVATSN